MPRSGSRWDLQRQKCRKGAEAAEPVTPDRTRGAQVEASTRQRQRDSLLEELFGNSALPNGIGERLLRTCDVALLFQVSERTVSEWARRGRVPWVRTPGGHRRYPAEQIRRLLMDGTDRT